MDIEDMQNLLNQKDMECQVVQGEYDRIKQIIDDELRRIKAEEKAQRRKANDDDEYELDFEGSEQINENFDLQVTNRKSVNLSITHSRDPRSSDFNQYEKEIDPQQSNIFDTKDLIKSQRSKESKQSFNKSGSKEQLKEQSKTID